MLEEHPAQVPTPKSEPVIGRDASVQAPVRDEVVGSERALKGACMPQRPLEILSTIVSNGLREVRELPLPMPEMPGVLEILRVGRSLQFLSGAERKVVYQQFVDAMLAREDVAAIGASTLPHLVRYSVNGERADLIRHLLNHREGNHRLATKLVIDILRSCQSLEQLREVVQTVGREELSHLASRQVREFVAWAVIGTAMRAAKVPQSVSTRLDLERADARIVELRAALNERIDIANADPILRGTEVAKRFRKIANEDLAYLERQLKRFKATERMASRRSKEGSPEAAIRRRRGLVSTMVEMMKVEFTFGINLTCEKNRLGRNVRVWKVEEVKKIHDLLSKKIPEGLTLFTPHLKEFRRVAGKGGDYNGLRDRDGQIHISDDGINDTIFAKQFDMRSPLLAILAHEQGHSLHIGEGRTAKTLISSRDGKILGPHDHFFNGAEFAELSGWRGYELSRCKIQHNGQAILIDGQTHPLDAPTRFQGRVVVFEYDSSEKLVFSYNAEAPFSARSYSRSSPWEDAAESFTEYVLMPQRLARMAPHKFFFWDLHIGKYEEKGWLYEIAHQKLQQLQEPAR
jgi:hypothetical protein